MIPNDGSPGINDLSNYEAGAQFDHIEGKEIRRRSMVMYLLWA